MQLLYMLLLSEGIKINETRQAQYPAWGDLFGFVSRSS